MILPLMTSSVIAATVTSTLSGENIYTLKLVRRGLDFNRKRNPDRMKAMYVGEVLRTERLTLREDVSLQDAWSTLSKGKEWFAVIRNSSGVILGSVARAQVLEELTEGRLTAPISSLLPPVIHRVDERATLAEALAKMHNLHVTYLLVCRGETPIGVVGSSDIVHAYQQID